MKKRIYHIAALAGLILFNTSCENYDEINIPEKYHKVLILQSAGEQDLTLYRTGEDSEYTMCIIKAGSEDNLSANGDLVIDQEWLQQYNEDNAEHLITLPSELYSCDSQNLNFTETDQYKRVNWTFKTTQIEQLLINNPDKEYVLPVRLMSDDTTISETNNYVILKPTVVVPKISFEKTGYQKTVITPASSDKITVEIPLILPLDNKWTFDCTVALDQASLDDYNAANGTSYQMPPVESYTLDESCNFTPGVSKAIINLVIDRTKLPLGEYILPVKLQSCSQAGFDIGTERFLAGISYVPPQIPLSLDMLSSNATVDGDGTGLTGLFDGLGGGKHYHSNYSGAFIDPIYGHYIDIHLGTAITSIMFDYYTRFENGNGAPKEIVLYTSNDGTTWTQLTTVNRGLPSGGNMEYQSSVFQSENPFTYLRFSVTLSAGGDTRTGGFFNLGELSIFGQ